MTRTIRITGDARNCWSQLGNPSSSSRPRSWKIDYWTRKGLSLQVWQSFVEDIANGAYRLEGLAPGDLLRTVELEQQYADLKLGFVDASVIAVCERLQETKVATLDRRHFGTVRPSHCDSFTLLPEPS